MVFKRMLTALGVGGPSVDTVLSSPNTRPGLPLAGHVNLAGGTSDVEIDRITVGLATRVEVERSDTEYDAAVEFHQAGVSGALRLQAGQNMSLPFEIVLPWETPVTDVYGQRLHGMTMGLRTDVSIRGALDKGDLDPVNVHPLPVQERILDAFASLGFRFKSADLERGYLHGVRQTLPFFQEIEFYASREYAGRLNEVELTFVADPYGVAIVLEFDKRGGLFTGGHDAFGRYRVEHADADQIDWHGQVDGWLRTAVQHGHASQAGYHGYEHGHGYYPEHHGHGSGIGGAVAGMAAGAALGFGAGMLADEVLDFGGDDEGEGEGDE